MWGSISAYYYSGMRNYFVGTMCALAVFFFSYKYAPRDNFLALQLAYLPLASHSFRPLQVGRTSR
jgi:hypothetical protein